MIIEILILKKKKDCILKQNKNMSQQIGWRAHLKVKMSMNYQKMKKLSGWA